MKKKLIASFILSILFVFPAAVLGLNWPEFNPGIQNPDISGPGGLIDRLFGFIWMAFAEFAVIMIIWAGILFLNPQGDPTKFIEVRRAVIWGAIGVVVALLSLSIPLIIGSVLFP